MQWLLFIPQLPAKPDYLRVKLRRRLSRLGAVPVKAGVYALPHQGDCLEDFAWLRQDLRKDDADAVICTTTLISGLSDDDLVELFKSQSEAGYHAVRDEAESAMQADALTTLARLRRRLKDVVANDYFSAVGRREAEQALRALETLNREARMSTMTTQSVGIGSGRTWVTRKGVKVDRIASAWLIRRFIDADAQFRFVDPATYQHVDGELRFDMFDGEFTHRGEHCTFETLVDFFGLQDERLRALCEIIHDIDMKESTYNRAESAGVAAFISGLVASEPSDELRLERGFVLFDAIRNAV